MGDHLYEIWQFIVAALWNWIAVVTGALVSCAWLLTERFVLKKELSRKWIRYFLLGFLPVAFFLAWQEQYHAARDAKADLAAQSNPVLRGKIDYVLIGEPSQASPSHLGVMLVATIYNTGAPTIVERYRLILEPQGGPALAPAIPQTLLDRMVWKPSEAGGSGYEFFGSDSLAVKTAETPITKGGSAKGILLFHVPKTENIVSAKQAKFTLLFTDVNGTDYVAVKDYSSLVAPQSFGFPGLKSGALRSAQEEETSRHAPDANPANAEIERLRAQLDHRERRKSIRAQIAKLLDEGNALKQTCLVPEEKPELPRAADDWANRTRTYLRSVDPSFASRFDASTGPTYFHNRTAQANDSVWNFINLRTQTLAQILGELRD